jgi:hypothetical protein
MPGGRTFFHPKNTEFRENFAEFLGDSGARSGRYESG